MSVSGVLVTGGRGALGLARRRGRNADVAITGAWAEGEIWTIGGLGLAQQGRQTG